MRSPGLRLTALIALVVFLFGMLFGQLWPRPLVAAAPLAQYLPLVMKHWLAPGPTPTAVPGGPNYLMLGPSDFVIKGPSITGYGYGTPPPMLTPIPTPTGEAPPTNGTIHLPQGAHVTQITVYYSGTTTLPATTRIELQRQAMSTFETLATLLVAPTQPSEADQVQSVQLANSAAVIDNSRYSYRLAIYSTRDPSTPFVVYQIRLDYQ